MLLQDHQRSKLDATNDNEFYAVPRFVTHVDEGFIQQLTDLYRERLKPQTRVLDLMSSWISHLPEDLEFAHVEGHGLNEAELAKNPRLDHYFVQNLNQNRALPFPEKSFDAVLIAVSVQYLEYPEEVFNEIYRVLKPGGIAIASFSNRMFYQKAIQVWRDGSEKSRVELVRKYFKSVALFQPAEVIARQANVPSFLQMMGMGGDPFYAVISHRPQV